MSRLLRLYWYYFSWQGVLVWTTLIGIALTLLAIPVPQPFDRLLIALGACLALAFPATFASVAYRLLISNRRFLMVPRLRTFAALSLLLVAITSTGVIVYCTDAFGLVERAALIEIGVTSFVLISSYLLLTQWLLSNRFGTFGLGVFVLVVAGIANRGNGRVDLLIFGDWPAMGVILLAWLWLLVASRGARPPRPLAVPQWTGASSPQAADQSLNYQWLPHSGPAMTPAGSLLRGVNDGWRNRIMLALMFLLSFPLTMSVMFFLIGEPLHEPFGNRFSPNLFLIWSYFGLSMHASFFYGEWPARLRLLWLRGIGDRSGGWRLVERLLRQDALLVGAITSVIAIAALLLSAVAPLYLALYVAGCVTTIFVASYLEFWMRLQGVSRPAKLLISLLASALPLALLVFAISSEHPGRIAWLLPLSIAGGMGVRGLAMRQTYRVDWCAVRPLRWIRRSV